MTEDNQEEDILLKLSMAGKSLRINPKDAPQLPEQQLQSSPSTAPAATPTDLQLPASSSQVARAQTQHQPQREVNTVVPPANTPPPTEEAQDAILRTLSMKPKDYTAATPTLAEIKSIQPPRGVHSQTAEEATSNKPYVSSEHEIEKVKKLAQNIYGSDMVTRKVRKK
ncbi:hypothetical protein HYS50_01100 [Candidatus Woesearchaeota archaeon]|nr:hypothetical protein [Candidatus Woesearchaeota archaeon]